MTLMDAAGTKDGVPFSLTIPAGALAVPTTIHVSEDIVPPAGFAPTTRGYKVEPLGLTFLLPVAMHLPWGEFTALGKDLCDLYRRRHLLRTVAVAG